MATTFSNKCLILSDLWMNYRDDENLEDFIEYNDMGLPLAYFINSEIVTPKDQATMFVDETFNLLLAALDVEDQEFESLNQLMSYGQD
jgi:hypothetical protein